MFIKNSFENEIVENLESELKQLSEQELQIKAKSQVIQYLTAASELLDQANCDLESQAVLYVLSTLDPATEGLTSEKMLNNLEEKGWLFNSDDCLYVEEEEKPIEQELIVVEE